MQNRQRLSNPGPFSSRNYFSLIHHDFNRGVSPDAEAPNDLKILAQPLTHRDTGRFQRARQLSALYRAASRLWTEGGVPIGTAIKVVASAMAQAGEF